MRLLPTARIAVLAALLAGLPAGSLARADGPSGQFQPAANDRDGDGLVDAHDCAPDDPSRPARAGHDADCDGSADDGSGSDVVITGPADGGPDPVSAASKPSTGTRMTSQVARAVAGEAVVLVRHLPLGRSVAIYRSRQAHRTAPAIVFAAKDNSGVTVTPTLVYAGGRRAKLGDRSRSVSRGHAWVVRVRLHGAQRRAQRLEFSIAVVDASGNSFSATRVVRIAAGA
jgi:hypothetical protein